MQARLDDGARVRRCDQCGKPEPPLVAAINCGGRLYAFAFCGDGAECAETFIGEVMSPEHGVGVQTSN